MVKRKQIQNIHLHIHLHDQCNYQDAQWSIPGCQSWCKLLVCVLSMYLETSILPVMTDILNLEKLEFFQTYLHFDSSITIRYFDLLLFSYKNTIGFFRNSIWALKLGKAWPKSEGSESKWQDHWSSAIKTNDNTRVGNHLGSIHFVFFFSMAMIGRNIWQIYQILLLS